MRWILSAGAFVVIGCALACAGPQPRSVEKAQASLAQALRDSNASKYAPQAIEKARLYLQKAQSGLDSDAYFYAELSRRYSESAIAQGDKESGYLPTEGGRALPPSEPDHMSLP